MNNVASQTLLHTVRRILYRGGTLFAGDSIQSDNGFNDNTIVCGK